MSVNSSQSHLNSNPLVKQSSASLNHCPDILTDQQLAPFGLFQLLSNYIDLCESIWMSINLYQLFQPLSTSANIYQPQSASDNLSKTQSILIKLSQLWWTLFNFYQYISTSITLYQTLLTSINFCQNMAILFNLGQLWVNFSQSHLSSANLGALNMII